MENANGESIIVVRQIITAKQQTENLVVHLVLQAGRFQVVATGAQNQSQNVIYHLAQQGLILLAILHILQNVIIAIKNPAKAGFL